MLLLRRILRCGLEFLVGALFGVITIFCLTQVVYRYMLSIPIPWIEEVSRLLLVWAVCLGAAAAVKNDAHLRIDFIANAGGPLWRRISSIIAHAVVSFVAFGMIVYGYEFYSLTAGDYSTSLGYARNLYYFPVAASGVLILLFSLAKIFAPEAVAKLRFAWPASDAKEDAQ